MSGSATRLLDSSARGLVAFAAVPGPQVVPLAQWYDGHDLWMAAAAGSAAARSLAEHPSCAVGVPAGDVVVVGTGQARVFGVGDPAGLALHAGPLSGALAVLATRNIGAVLGSLRDALLAPARLGYPVVVRVGLDDVAVLAWNPTSAGIAPALPAVVPADVRRALAGQRAVLVAHGAARPRLVPATWDEGFRLVGANGLALDLAGPVAVAVDTGPPERPTEVRGLALQGTLAGGRLTATRATWWRGLRLESADVPATPARGVVLPD